ncbi:hypothetical protein ACJJTC_012772 [Scirpophaga incertulas]
MHSLTVLVLALAALVAAVPKNPQRIVGGSTTSIDNYPETVVLLWSRTSTGHRHNCGGCILNNRAVLTASHCVDGDSPANWQARAGSSYAHSGGVLYRSSQLIMHEEYNRRTLDNDVAIIRLVGTIGFGGSIQPARVAGTNYQLGDNQVVYAVGWGRTSPGGPVSEQLRHVQIWTVNQAICRERYANIGGIVSANMLCSGYLDVGGRDQCQGDSGGPLFHNGVVVGVCSWGQSCALAFYPGVNARVSRYAPWIQRNA